MTDAPLSGLRARSVGLIRKAAALSERIGGGPLIEKRSGVHGPAAAFGRHRGGGGLVNSQTTIWLNDDKSLTLGVTTRFEYVIP